MIKVTFEKDHLDNKAGDKADLEPALADYLHSVGVVRIKGEKPVDHSIATPPSAEIEADNKKAAAEAKKNVKPIEGIEKVKK